MFGSAKNFFLKISENQFNFSGVPPQTVSVVSSIVNDITSTTVNTDEETSFFSPSSNDRLTSSLINTKPLATISFNASKGKLYFTIGLF